MRRPVSVTIAAAVGVVGLVGLKLPYGDVRDAALAPPTQVGHGRLGVPVTPGTGPSPGPSDPPELTTRTVTGSRVAAGDYGYVQVQVTLAGPEVTEITFLEVATSPKRQVREAPGTLVQEALAAQSADIDNVSGATYTSEAFKESLRSALAGA